MRFFRWLILIVLLLAYCQDQKVAIVYRPIRLTCEYQINPIAIEKPVPRLSWQIACSGRSWYQLSYRILVASDKAKLDSNLGDLWDSGVTMGDNINILYDGFPLSSYADVWWKVKVWNPDGKESDWSDPAYWKMGCMEKNAWEGQWIASDLQLQPLQQELKARPDFAPDDSDGGEWERAKGLRPRRKDIETAPAVYMRKKFNAAKRIRQATAYVCGLGLHELYLNGERVGDAFLNPAQTDYQKRVFYNVYDVTRYCKKGSNALGVILGNGWYNLITPHTLRFDEADYIEPPRLSLQLRLTYEDGTKQVVASDESWKFNTEGPITFNCLLAGETYDSRKELLGWDRAKYDDQLWKQCLRVDAPQGKLTAQQLYPVRVLKQVPAQKVEKTANGYRVDLGQDLCGWARFELHGRKGQQVTVNYLGADSHTLGRYQTCVFILNGGKQYFTSRFHYAGFRYIDISGLEYAPKPAQITGQLVNSDLPVVGSFSCSNEKLTRMQQILVNTVRNYIIHIPNDPVREKAGWTQDVESGFDVNAYNFDSALMYRKWQRDFLDIMFDNGYVPPVAPGRFRGYHINGPWWGGMVMYTPYKLHMYYQDDEIIRESYDGMKKYMGYLKSIANNHIIEWGLGEWLEPFSKNDKYTRRTPVALTSTCAYYYYANIMSQFARLLCFWQEEKYYHDLATEIKTAFNHMFYNPTTAQYATGSQGSQLMALYCGLVPDAEKDRVIAALKEQILRDQLHLSTGFVATPVLLTGLSDLGLGELAYTIATQETYPSWFDMVFNQGNTVLKEDWDGGKVQMPSLAGPIGYWFFRSLAGIRIDESLPAFKRVVIKPDLVGDLTWVSAKYNSIRGEIVSSWSRTDSTYTLKVQVPPNTNAIVYLPADRLQQIYEGGQLLQPGDDIKVMEVKEREILLYLGSGVYDFTVNRN
jgi:alpha-L-rhamnosidase